MNVGLFSFELPSVLIVKSVIGLQTMQILPQVHETVSKSSISRIKNTTVVNRGTHENNQLTRNLKKAGVQIVTMMTSL